jgi:hypothetical protein
MASKDKDYCAYDGKQVTATVTSHDENGRMVSVRRVCADHVETAAEDYEARGLEARVHLFREVRVGDGHIQPVYDGPRVAVAQ